MTDCLSAPAGRRPPGKYGPATLVAAAWTVVSLRRARRQLRTRGLGARIPGPPRLLPPGAGRGVMAVLRRTAPTCLERAAVLQTWLAAHGVAVDVVVGVNRAGGAVQAHAWIDGNLPAADVGRYREIHRIPVPSRR